MAVQKIIEWLKSYGTSNEDGRCFAVKFHDEPWMEFSAEWQDWSSLEEGREILYFGYYFEENGDLCQDPEFKITLQDGKVTNISQLNWALGAVDATADPHVTEFAEEVWRRHFEPRATMGRDPMVIEAEKRDYVVRSRLLSYVVENINDGVINIARDAIGDILSDCPDAAEELLKPIFNYSTFWPEDMAKDALGLSQFAEHDLEDLLERFEAKESCEEAEGSEKTNYKEGENGSI